MIYRFQGLGSMSDYLLAMFMVYLEQIKKLNERMSTHEIVRIVWIAFGELQYFLVLSISQEILHVLPL